MTTNQRVAKRILDAFDQFGKGEIDLPQLQEAFVGHGFAIEGLGNEWHSLVNRVESQLESIRFTRNNNEWIVEGAKAIAIMRKTLEGILSA